MDQETTYIRNDTMEQNNSHQADTPPSTNRGVYEWLKFVVFFAAIFLITVLIIRVIGPIIFTEYVPPIMGLTEESSEIQIEDESTDATDSQEVTPIEIETEAESESVTTSEAGESSGASETSDTSPEVGSESTEENSEANEVVDGESNPLPTEDETSNKVDEEESDTAENSDPLPSVVYIVLPGDTLTSIAAANSVTVEQLLAANELINPNFLQPGQEILIPQ